MKFAWINPNGTWKDRKEAIIDALESGFEYIMDFDNADTIKELGNVSIISDKDNADISSITMKPVVATATETSAGVAVKTDWNKVSSTMLCEVVQPMVQSTEDYSAMSNVVVYIGKIIAE